MARVLPRLIFAFTLLITSIKSSTSSTMAKPGCRETCGHLTIPYPFGIGSGCYYDRGFDVSCEDNHTFMHNSSSQVEIYNISLLRGQARVNTLIASKCYGSNIDGWASTQTAPLFTLSSKANKLTAVGCNTLAFLGGYNEHQAAAGCFSMCLNKQSVDRNGQCSGTGCCQTSIAPNLHSFNISFDERYNNSEVHEFNQCSYAFVAEQDSFKFDASYLEGNKLTEEFKDGVPAVLDWVVGRTSCDEAVKNMASYACISKNSQCIESQNAIGYLCNCSKGFAGNPYLTDGCQGKIFSGIHPAL
jgi:hypothetical protein